MSFDEVDQLFHLLENPTRRRILQLLSIERLYPLKMHKQLSKEMDVTQVTGTTPQLVKDGENIIIPYRWVQDLDDVVILRHFPDKIELTKEDTAEFSFEEDDDDFYDEN